MDSASSNSSNDVLIIDDDPDVVSVLENYCEELEIFRMVITAKDGSEAQQKLQNQNFAVILLDLNMPRKSGLDLVSDFKNYGKNNLDSLIVVSGEVNQMNLNVLLTKGVKNFLIKPFDEETFKKSIVKSLKATKSPLLKRL